MRAALQCKARSDNLLCKSSGSGYSIEVAEMHPRTVSTAVKHCKTFAQYKSSHEQAAHTASAFAEAKTFVDSFYSSRGVAHEQAKLVILDSGCGRGLSTLRLAEAHPDVPVIGVDRSVARLSRNRIFVRASEKCGAEREEEEEEEEEEGESEDRKGYDDEEEALLRRRNDGPPPSNAMLLRAELADFWMLAAFESNWLVQSHFILYPNPYPKAKHLQRRWHGHASFPVLLALGGQLVIRSNWRTYCEEMAEAIRAVSHPHLFLSMGEFELAPGSSPISHFERKYLQAGEKLYETTAALGIRSQRERLDFLCNLSASLPPP